MSAPDPFIGQVFEDRDPRAAGRRIRVLELHPDNPKWRRDDDLVTYRAIRINEHGEPIGQRVRIMRRTLRTHYQRSTP